MSKPHVIILGAGPAGLGAAYRLTSLDRATVTVVEQRSAVGGNAGSFEAGGQHLDYGSHRLHPACAPEILADIRRLLGDDLLERPRHGRILLQGRWIRFPLRPLDLLLRLRPSFTIAAARDAVGRATSRRRGDAEGSDTFASILSHRLGPTICEHFYFPYARKIWGVEPEELSDVQARRRVSANSFTKLMRKVLSRTPGFRRGGGFSHFYYPRKGYGQISQAYAEAASAHGAEVLLEHRVTRLSRSGAPTPWSVVIEGHGEQRTLRGDHVWSTLPISGIARMIDPVPEAAVSTAARSLAFRAMLLVYVELSVDRFTEYDAHYFPDASVSITRLSEPKNYSASVEPADRTTLCVEIPCDADGALWRASDDELGGLVSADLDAAGIPLPVRPSAIRTVKLRHAYPIYTKGFEVHFRALDEWAAGIPGFLSFGRQGLFAHDNTHHALFMAYSAAECLREGSFDDRSWAACRAVFDTHVVED